MQETNLTQNVGTGTGTYARSPVPPHDKIKFYQYSIELYIISSVVKIWKNKPRLLIGSFRLAVSLAQYNSLKSVFLLQFFKCHVYDIVDQFFLRLYNSAPRPPLFPSPVIKLYLFFCLPVCRPSSLLTGEQEGEVIDGKRGARSQITKSFSTL
jgi:hypothetical protein